MAKSRIPEILSRDEREILADWMQAQLAARTWRPDLLGEAELRHDCAEFLSRFQEAVQDGNLSDAMGPAWQPVREMLSNLSRSRARQGFTPADTAMFVFSLKQPLFDHLRREVKDADVLGSEIWAMTTLLDRLGLHTFETFQKSRDEIIRRQQQELLELSTPVVRLWNGVLAIPLIGTLDSARTQVVMESLLGEIMKTGSPIAIIDITGVPLVDTLVAQHLLKTVAAARLMGADCIISGIRPQIAQTIIHLGVELSDVITKASLADAFRLALKKLGLMVAPVAADRPRQP